MPLLDNNMVWFREQIIITTNPERLSCILLYQQALLVFHHIVGIP